MIYDLLDLPPVSHAYVGLALSCRKALIEPEQAAVRGLNHTVEGMMAAPKSRGRLSSLPKYPANTSFASLNKITIITSWATFSTKNKDAMDELDTLLDCYFSRITVDVEDLHVETVSTETDDDTDQAAVSGGNNTKAHMILNGILSRFRDLHTGRALAAEGYTITAWLLKPVRAKQIQINRGDDDFLCIALEPGNFSIVTTSK